MPDFLIFILFTYVGLAMLLAYKIAQIPRTPATRALFLLSVSTAIWSAGYAAELLSSSLEASLFWAKVGYIGIVTIPVAWYLFSYSYTSPSITVDTYRGWFLLLWIIPGLTLILVITNSAHELIWRDLSLKMTGPFSFLSVSYGPWFWVHTIYSYLLLLIGSILLAGVLIGSMRMLRWQTALVLIAICIPWISNLLHISGLLPGLDITPFAFFISCLLFFVSLYQFNLGSTQPFPRDAMIDGISDGVLMLDTNSRILDLNTSAGAIIGLPVRKLIGQDLIKQFPEKEALLTKAPLEETITTITIGDVGESQNYKMVISPLVSQENNLRGRLIVLHKIDPQAHIYEVNDMSAHVQQIVELEPDAMLVVNRERQIVLCNNHAERLFGYEQDELRRQKLDALIPGRYRSKHEENVLLFFTYPSSRPMGTPMSLYALKKDGSEFSVDISLSPLKMGKELLVACAIRDMSAHKQIEHALRESEETYRALFEHANDAIFLLSMEGIHLRVNQKAAELLGYTQEELIGKGVADIVVPGEYASAQDRLSSLLRGETLPIYERAFRKKDGSTLPVEINLSLIRDDTGQPTMIQSIVRDISERKKVQQEQYRLLIELQRSHEELRALEAHLIQVVEEERRALAAELHDRVGQNLTGLNLNLNIISSQVRQYDDRAIGNRLEDSIVLVEETTSLVRNVMADLHPPMLDDYGLFSALSWYSEKFTQRTNIHTTVDGQEFHPRLPAQVELVIFRIVQEALNNALKHAGADRITIRISSTRNAASICIEDNGVGFDQEKLEYRQSRESHWGLLNMQERAWSIGGSLIITSAPAQGTKIEIRINRDGDHD